MRRVTLLRHRAARPAARSRRLPWPRWRRLRRTGSRLLTLVLVVCMLSSTTLSRAAADQPAAEPVSGQGATRPLIPTVTVVPQITSVGSIQETLTPWSVQVQPMPTQPIALASCTSPNYIFQGCSLASPAGVIHPDAERRLEDQAIASVMQQYQLPDSDRPLVLRYARKEVRAALFAQIENAFQAPSAQRTPDQQLLVDVFTRLVREKHLQATRAALSEYQKWQADPCGYRPPPGFSYSPSSTACSPIASRLLTTPESPGLKGFVSYGWSRAYAGTAEPAAAGYVPASVTDPQASPVFWATSNAALLGYGAVGAGFTGALGAAGVLTQLAPFVATLTPELAKALIPFAVKVTHIAPQIAGWTAAGFPIVNGTSTTTVALANPASTAAALGGTLAVIVVALTIAITAGTSVANEAAIPGALQALVNTAGSYDPEYIIQTCSGQVVCASVGNGDLRSTLDTELFANLVLTTLPDYPGTDPAPAAQPGDPQLVVAGSPVDWVQYKADDGTQRSFRLSRGSWFVDRAGNAGAGTLTLSIQYQDASGGTWTARRVGNQFLAVRTDISPIRPDYPLPQQSPILSVVDWSGNSVTATAGG